MNALWIVVATVLAGLGITGTGPTGPAPPADRDAGHLVQSWSQGRDEEVGPGVVSGQVVVSTEAERDAFVRRLPSRLPTDGVEAVDFTTHVIVAGGYHRCQESSRVVVTDDGYEFDVVEGDDQVACAWSPYTVDVHAVPR